MICKCARDHHLYIIFHVCVNVSYYVFHSVNNIDQEYSNRNLFRLSNSFLVRFYVYNLLILQFVVENDK